MSWDDVVVVFFSDVIDYPITGYMRKLKTFLVAELLRSHETPVGSVDGEPTRNFVPSRIYKFHCVLVHTMDED